MCADHDDLIKSFTENVYENCEAFKNDNGCSIVAEDFFDMSKICCATCEAVPDETSKINYLLFVPFI